MRRDDQDGAMPVAAAVARLFVWQRELVHGIGTPQHRALALYLCLHGRTSCSVLERACDVRSVTSRFTEMIDAGLPIAKSRGHERRRDGTLRAAKFYEVTGPSPQRSLFEAA